MAPPTTWPQRSSRHLAWDTTTAKWTSGVWVSSYSSCEKIAQLWNVKFWNEYLQMAVLASIYVLALVTVFCQLHEKFIPSPTGYFMVNNRSGKFETCIVKFWNHYLAIFFSEYIFSALFTVFCWLLEKITPSPTGYFMLNSRSSNFNNWVKQLELGKMAGCVWHWLGIMELGKLSWHLSAMWFNSVPNWLKLKKNLICNELHKSASND